MFSQFNAVKYKKLLSSLICLIIMSFCIISSKNIGSFIVSGIKLCLYCVIPSLLPFMLITNYMLSHNLCHIVAAVFYPFFNRLMGLSKVGAFAAIIGFTCGYPMGAKTIGDLYNSESITLKEAQLLITFCNVSSISFLINYILNNCLNNCVSPFVLIVFIYIPPILTGILNSHFFRLSDCKLKTTAENNHNPITATIYSLATLSMYIICFNVLVNLIISFNNLPLHLKYIVAGLAEITTASMYISGENNLYLKIYLICGFVILSGFSIMLQSFSFLPNKTLKKYYLIGKIENFIIFSILFVLWLFFIKQN